MSTEKPHIFALVTTGAGESTVVGIYSTLEGAQAEGQRYHRSSTLQWVKMITDSRRLGMWRAPLVAWHTPNCFIEIWRYRLDSKKFR